MSEQKYVEAFGVINSTPDIRDYKLKKVEKNFPKTFELSMPAVKNQFTISSCVAHSMATIIEYYNGKAHKSSLAMSVGYIYGNRAPNESQKEGMNVKNTIDKLCKEGDVALYVFPYNEEVPNIINRVNKDKQRLKEYVLPSQFSGYVKVSKPEEIKTVLMAGCPVAIAVDWQEDMKVKNGIITSQFKEYACGHCMVLYGWDEKGWKLQNSWGVFWGDGGRAIYPYSYPIREAYGVLDNDIEKLEIKTPFKCKTKVGKTVVKCINKTISTTYGLIGTVKKFFKKKG